jgi:hypothetical protein
VGDPSAAEVQALLRVCQDGYRPHQVLAVGNPSDPQVGVPLLTDRKQIDGKPTAYVCVDFTCRRPVTDPEALRRILEA